MARESLLLALGRVIVAAAWADGEITHDEVNSLKDLLLRLPGLTQQEWARLDMYIETPVGADERQRLVDELAATMFSNRDRQFAIDALNDLIQADGIVTGEEKQVVHEIIQQIDDTGIGLMGGLSRLVDSAMNRRTAIVNAPNREDYFEDFIKNKVYYEVQRRLGLGEEQLDLPEFLLRKLSLAGGIMAQIAHVDKTITNEEYAAIASAFEQHWEIDAQQASFVAKVSTAPETANLDVFRTAREFVKVSSHDERLTLMDILFTVAAADGDLSYEETETIRDISRSLLVSHSEFITAKTKINKNM